ncbi:hypothetical protein NDU88_005145 [Pleurodeles waltl]|uniref:Uncharacterized protein n=1 Tax=Pleurodeles waltl TaxID=8319 RepID=A0AAV7PIR7_PLEWA|nr:hypothetical protein NDU88_005145 [Pleurodeles waltl]
MGPVTLSRALCAHAHQASQPPPIAATGRASSSFSSSPAPGDRHLHTPGSAGPAGSPRPRGRSAAIEAPPPRSPLPLPHGARVERHSPGPPNNSPLWPAHHLSGLANLAWESAPWSRAREEAPAPAAILAAESAWLSAGVRSPPCSVPQITGFPAAQGTRRSSRGCAANRAVKASSGG